MKNTTDFPFNSEETIYYYVFLQYLPVAVFFGVAAVVGIIGNTIAVKFYRLRSQPKTSFTVLVKYLAYTDLTVCILLVLAAIEVGFNIGFKFKYVCKVEAFLDEWSIYTSIWILAVITVDRYRKICQPFNWQLSERLARNSMPVIVMFTFMISIRNVFTYDIVSLNVTVNVNDRTSVITGYHCAITTDLDMQIPVYIFHWFDVAICSSLFLVYLIVYSLITHKLVQHRKSLKAWHQRGLQPKAEEVKSADKHLQRDTTVSSVIEETTKDGLTDFSVLSEDFKNSNIKDVMKRTKTTDSTEKTTRGANSSAADGNGIHYLAETTAKDEYTTNTRDDPSNAEHDQVCDTSNSIEHVDKASVDGNGKCCFDKEDIDKRAGTQKHKHATRRSEYQITVMMLWVTIVFLLSLSSFFFASLMFRQDPHSELAIKPLTHFMIKSAFLNSVSNPLIYFIYNGTFRRFAKKCLSCSMLYS